MGIDMRQSKFDGYKWAITGCLSLIVINWILSIATKHFVLLAQRHVSHPLSEILLAVLAILLSILLATTILLSLKFLERQDGKTPENQGVYVAISVVITLNFLYWFFAVLMSDSACVKCGGYHETMYFWIERANMHP
jgi:uncharacterized protein YacL